MLKVAFCGPHLKNRIDPNLELAVCEYTIEQPAHGQVRVSNELRKRGVFVSPAGFVQCGYGNDLENFKKRLKALEGKVAADGIILTDDQVAALERKKLDDEVSGEIETHHPGYLGSQDTFYVGNLKGVGRIYQQTFVDTYSKGAFAKLYTTKTPITAADTLNDRVLPFFASQVLPLLRILTSAKARNKKEEFLSTILQRLNELFITDNLTDDDMLNYAHTVADKVGENERVMHLLRNNTPYQAFLGDSPKPWMMQPWAVRKLTRTRCCRF